MYDFTCPRCNKTLSSKQNLLKHLIKKRVCEPYSIESNIDTHSLIKELQEENNKNVKCEHCNKQFSSIYNLKRHQKESCRINHISIIKDKTKNIEEYKTRIEHLEERIKILEYKNCNTNINSGIISGNTQNNINIQIHNFGQEDISHLSETFLSDCLLNCNGGVTNLIKNIHFNPDFPENHNIRSLSKKQNMLETYSDGAWHPCDKNNTLDKMIKNGYKILFRHFSKSRLSLKNEEEQQRNEFINEYLLKLMQKDGNIYYELRRDLYMLILDGDFYIIGK